MSFVLWRFYEYCNIPDVFYCVLYLNTFYRREIFLQVTYIYIEYNKIIARVYRMLRKFLNRRVQCYSTCPNEFVRRRESIDLLKRRSEMIISKYMHWKLQFLLNNWNFFAVFAFVQFYVSDSCNLRNILYIVIAIKRLTTFFDYYATLWDMNST